MSNKEKTYQDPYSYLMDQDVDTSKETKFTGPTYSTEAKNKDQVATTAYTNSGSKDEFMNDRLENAGE